MRVRRRARTRVAHERVLVRGGLLQALDELRVLVLQLRRVGLLDPVRAASAFGDRGVSWDKSESDALVDLVRELVDAARGRVEHRPREVDAQRLEADVVCGPHVRACVRECVRPRR